MRLKKTQRKDVVLDPTQQQAADFIKTGANVAISGNGGSGKTFTALYALMLRIRDYPLMFTETDSHYTSLGVDPNHKYLNRGVPGVLFISYTNPAVTVLRRNIDTSDLVLSYVDPATGEHNIKRVQPADMAMTVHKLLQYRPADAETAQGLDISTGSFYPYRNADNKLPPEITTIVLDEVGLLEISLTLKLMDAVDINRIQFIFIGDICQTGAPYGPSTLIRALVKLPRIAFDKTYRFSGELLKFANEINHGEVTGITGSQLLRKGKQEGKATDIVNIGFFTPAEEESTEKAMDRFKAAIFSLIMSGRMSLYTDMFIFPQKTQDLSGGNVMGEVNSLMDKWLGRPTFYLNTNAAPIILAVGDAILYDNKVGMVLDIGKNPGYVGDKPIEPMYVATRDVETWELLYKKEHLNTMDSIAVGGFKNETSYNLDQEINKPVSLEDMYAGLDLPEEGANLTVFVSEEDEDEGNTRQLTQHMLVLDITSIDNGFVNYTPETVDALYKAFTTELVDTALHRHAARQPTSNSQITDESVRQCQDLLESLCIKYGISQEDVILKHMRKTSDLSSTGVKYNWRTVQQTQGSESFSTFSGFHRKAHMPTLMFRENLYTAQTRAQHKQYGLFSKALLDGSLSSGGVNGQRYPGLTVEDKLRNYVNKPNRVAGKDELALDGILDKLYYISQKRLAYYNADETRGKNILLDNHPKQQQVKKDVVSSFSLTGVNDEQPF